MPRRKRELTEPKDALTVSHVARRVFLTDRAERPAPENWLTRLAIVLGAFDRMTEAEQRTALRIIQTQYPAL